MTALPAWTQDPAALEHIAGAFFDELRETDLSPQERVAITFHVSETEYLLGHFERAPEGYLWRPLEAPEPL